jgi:hypothetical protein
MQLKQVSGSIFLRCAFTCFSLFSLEAEENSNTKLEPFELSCKEPGTVTISSEGNQATMLIRGGRGIGRATIQAANKKFPTKVILRYQLKGLENLVLTKGEVKLTASVSSSGDHPRSLLLTRAGKEQAALTKESQFWMTISIYDSEHKLIDTLPSQDGYFQMIIPQALLQGENPLEIEWIDFYR